MNTFYIVCKNFGIPSLERASRCSFKELSNCPFDGFISVILMSKTLPECGFDFRVLPFECAVIPQN